MSMSLVQQALGGNASGTFTAAGGGTTVSTGNFGSNTVAGNLLVAVCYHNQHRTSGVGFAPSLFSISTPGITWSAILLTAGFDASPNRQGCTIFAAANAPSLSSATTTTVTTSNDPGTSANGTEVNEFALYEFSGISKVVNYITGNGLIDVKGSGSGTASTPNAGDIVTDKTCLVVVDYKGNSANISAGSGYTLGQNMTVATFGQFQFRLDVPAGTIATAFSGGTETNWGAGAIAFQAPAATGFCSGSLIGF